MPSGKWNVFHGCVGGGSIASTTATSSDWLVRKPGAFENYVYREELFPTSRFRMAYDALREAQPERGHKEYLGILYLAARQSETAVDEALRTLLSSDRPVTRAAVEELVRRAEEVPAVTDVIVEEVDLSSFDDLLTHKGERYKTGVPVGSRVGVAVATGGLGRRFEA